LSVEINSVPRHAGFVAQGQLLTCKQIHEFTNMRVKHNYTTNRQK